MIAPKVFPDEDKPASLPRSSGFGRVRLSSQRLTYKYRPPVKSLTANDIVSYIYRIWLEVVNNEGSEKVSETNVKFTVDNNQDVQKYFIM